MNEIYSRGGRTSSSAFIATYEPTNQPINMDRILLEAHTTRSKKMSSNEGLSGESIRNEFSLVTIICSVPPVDMSWLFASLLWLNSLMAPVRAGRKSTL